MYLPLDGVKSNQSHMFLGWFWVTADDIVTNLVKKINSWVVTYSRYGEKLLEFESDS